MDQTLLHESESTDIDEGQVSPDYASWGEIREAPRNLLVPFLDFLGRRKITEIAIILAQVGLFLLLRDIIATGGGLGQTQRFACILCFAFMIWSPALYLYYCLAAENRTYAQNLARQESPPQPGDERDRAEQT